MSYIYFALMAFFGWGVGDIFGTIAARKMGAFSSLIWSYGLRLLIFSAYIPFAWHLLHNYSVGLVALNLVLATLLLSGWLAFNEGLRIANPSIVGTIASAYIALVVLLSLIFLGESLTAPQVLAILSVFIGLIFVGLDFSVFRKINFLSHGVALAIIAMIGWGIYFTFVKILVRHVGWFWPNYISFSLLLVLVAFSKLRKITIKSPLQVNSTFPLLATVILTATAEFSFNFAISRGQSSVVAPIAGSNVMLFVLLSSLVFHEAITSRQKVGVGLLLAGIVALSAISS